MKNTFYLNKSPNQRSILIKKSQCTKFSFNMKFAHKDLIISTIVFACQTYRRLKINILHKSFHSGNLWGCFAYVVVMSFESKLVLFKGIMNCNFTQKCNQHIKQVCVNFYHQLVINQHIKQVCVNFYHQLVIN